MKHSFNFSNWRRKSVLRQLSVDDIDRECETVATQKENATKLALHHLFEKPLDLIQVKEGEEKEESDRENSLQFR